MRITRFTALLTLAMAASPTLMAATRVTPHTNASSSNSMAAATKLPANMELRSSLHAGASNALLTFTAAGARPSVTCWADVTYPGHIGSYVSTTITWQCSPGIEKQISPVASLTDQNGTRYQGTKTCYNDTYCQLTVNAPYSAGTWTAKADYAFVVAYDNSSSYWTGGSISWLVP